MAAYAALLSLMQVINDIEHHPSPSISLDKQLVLSITQHITLFQEFLHAYNPPLDEEVVDPLEMRIASAAYAAEDAIESHIVESIQKQGGNIGGSKITQLISFFEPINENDEKIKSINPCHDRLQSVIKEMDLIKKVVVRKVDTDDKKMLVVRDPVPMKNVLESVSCNDTMVGSDAVSHEIMEKLTRGHLDFQVIPIVGMGGIGKTFFARSIYATPLVKEHFYICAWAVISQQYNTKEILCEILSQATKINKEQLSEKREHELGSELHKYLFGRRFLIVLDDMWSIDPWDQIQRFFPNNENVGSRVLVTSRLSHLGSQLNKDYSFRMSFLDKATSWDLFSVTVFGDKSCPHELMEIGEKIVDNCRGLPLSIVVVGGLLKQMDETPASWESTQDNLSSVVKMEHDKHCLKLLKMSYNHLPAYLKPCFLYMGVFEEDNEIFVSTLIKLWVSEGFLKPTNAETLKTIARGFIQELIDRNLILVHKLGSTGSIKSCKIHDLLRDLCLKEGQKDGFYHVIGQCNPPPQGCMSTHRRVIIPSNISSEKVHNELKFMPQARSIISKYDTGTRVSPFRNMRLLRTLHEYCDESYLNYLAFGHVNLRHLTIKGNKMSSSLLPSLVSHTWNLHTLKVDVFHMPTIFFNDFWKRPMLKHIEFVRSYFHLPDPPSDVVIMENLHTVNGALNFKCCEGVIKRIPNIKKLKLRYDDGVDEYFVGNIKSLCRLESLYIQSWNSYVHDKLTFPRTLKKLFLWMDYKFEWEDIMEKISSLPFLEKLELWFGCFGKGGWETEETQFSCLKTLKLQYCRGLENWTVAEEGSSILPRLENLHLMCLKELKNIPCELGNIDTLKSVEMNRCGEGAVRSVKEMVDEQVESQGEEQLSFHVVVKVTEKDKHLLTLADPNFEVEELI